MQSIFTIGHSTREISDFIGLLLSHKITQLVDIRTIPNSAHNPQFGQTELEKSLSENGIKYVYIKKLGGLRPAVSNSINGAWRNKSFRNYADYMQSVEFKQGLNALITLSKNAVTAIMCAEAVPWRCHRSLVSDALLINDIPVCEIIGSRNVREHVLTSFSVVNATTITYPKSDLTLEENDDE